MAKQLKTVAKRGAVRDDRWRVVTETGRVITDMPGLQLATVPAGAVLEAAEGLEMVVALVTDDVYGDERVTGWLHPQALGFASVAEWRAARDAVALGLPVYRTERR